MNIMRFLVRVALVINMYNVYCSESTVTKTEHGLKQKITKNRMLEKTRKEMQQEILGLHEIQNPIEMNAMETSAAQFMLELYKKVRSGDKYETALLETNQRHLALNNSHLPDIHEINGADLIMSFVNVAYKPDFRQQDRDSMVYVDFSDVSPGYIISKAELRLYKECTTRQTKSIFINIFRLRQGNDTEEKILEPEANLTVSADSEGWLSINVSDAANYWNVNRNTNFGLYMQVTDEEMGQVIDLNKSGIVGLDGPNKRHPFMICFFKKQDGQHVRRTNSWRKRQNISSSEKEEAQKYSERGLREYTSSRKSDNQQVGSQKCQRHPLYINFTALEWKHIIAPPGYNVFYCAGECNQVPGVDTTAHSVIQSLLNVYEPDKVPKPCCSPSKMSRQQVLFTDDNKNVILKYYDDMVVETCGCF